MQNQADFKHFIADLEKIVHERNLSGYKGIQDQLPKSLEGLSYNQVEQNVEMFGKNVLPQVKQKMFFHFVFDAAQDKVLILLSIAALISLILHHNNGDWIEGAAIIVAVIIVISVNAVNDWKKDRLFRSLNQRNQDGLRAKVKRSGCFDLISVQDLTIYDLIVLEPGCMVPADAILLQETHCVVVDESTATGESRSLTKSFEKDPFLLSGTKIIDGSGLAVVIGIGETSFQGRLLMALRGESELTPLQIHLNSFAESIAKYGLLIALLLLIALIVKNASNPKIWDLLPEFVIEAITIVVVAVPEGLPMAVTLSLAFATNRMLKENNLVRVLASCETMGRVTCICSDKTGTLTENRMTVVRSTFEEHEENDETDKQSTTISAIFSEIMVEGLAVNSTAFECVDSSTGALNFVGSATEAALLRFIKDRFSQSYVLLRKTIPLQHTIPFNSSRKLMLCVTQSGRVHLKGAAEVVLQKCKLYLDPQDGSIRFIDDVALRKIRRQLAEMSFDALRNIGQAFCDVVGEEDLTVDEGLLSSPFVWIGAFGIEDPLRAGVQEAVGSCQGAGIFVRMVTGDCRETAESIARRCGILMRGGLVMEGSDFRALTDDQLVEKLPKLQVLARSSPLDKMRLVTLLRNRIGEIVAVTGDGSNDGPALKAAHVGFSMGLTGTQLAQEASSIVLLDDNFASIVKAVSWGRCITRSVRKFIQFQLTVNVSAVLISMVTGLTTQRSVLTAVQMLWVNLVMDSFGALALATDSPTADLLQGPPEHPGSPLIPIPMYWLIGSQAILQLGICLGIFYFVKFSDEGTLRSFTFNTFLLLQLVNELICRIPWDRSDFRMAFDVKNWMFWMIWVGSLMAQIGIVQLGGRVFATTPLTLVHWIQCCGLALLSLPCAWIVKTIKPWCWFKSSSISREQGAPLLLHPTREQLAWQSAFRHVRAHSRFYSAIRRKLASTPALE